MYIPGLGEMIQFWQACGTNLNKHHLSLCSIYFVTIPLCDPDPELIVQWVDSKTKLKPKTSTFFGEHSALVFGSVLHEFAWNSSFHLRKLLITSGSQGAPHFETHPLARTGVLMVRLVSQCLELTFGLEHCFSEGTNEIQDQLISEGDDFHWILLHHVTYAIVHNSENQLNMMMQKRNKHICQPHVSIHGIHVGSFFQPPKHMGFSTPPNTRGVSSRHQPNARLVKMQVGIGSFQLEIR